MLDSEDAEDANDCGNVLKPLPALETDWHAVLPE